MAAVAGRFEMVPDHARYIAVYPAYVVVRGPSKDVTVPNIKNQPWWPGRLFPCKGIIARGLRHLSDVPQLRQGVAPPVDEGHLDLQDSPVKQKEAPIEQWGTGVHQIVLWAGKFDERNTRRRLLSPPEARSYRARRGSSFGRLNPGCSRG